MKIQIVKNKYSNALLLLMLFSAIVHMVILILTALWEGNLHLLNYFNILQISQFISGYVNSYVVDVVSFGLVLILYLLILRYNK